MMDTEGPKNNIDNPGNNNNNNSGNHFNGCEKTIYNNDGNLLPGKGESGYSSSPPPSAQDLSSNITNGLNELVINLGNCFLTSLINGCSLTRFAFSCSNLIYYYYYYSRPWIVGRETSGFEINSEESWLWYFSSKGAEPEGGSFTSIKQLAQKCLWAYDEEEEE